MAALDDYMTIFEEAQRRSLAPTSDVSSERDVNVPEPELPGYLSSVVAPPTAALPTKPIVGARQRVVGTATARVPPMFTFSTPGKVGASVSPSRGTIRTAAAAGGTSSPSPSTSPAADSPLPPPPDALPPPPVALPSGGGIVTNRPSTSPTTSGESSGSGIGTIAVLIAAGAAAWWFFVRNGDDDEKKGVRGLGDGYDHAAHNLKLFMDSTQSVAVKLKGPYNRNAEKWKRLGKYDPKKAPKLWYWFVEKGIKAYKQEHGDDDSGSTRLSKEQKMALAREYAREWEAQNGIAAG